MTDNTDYRMYLEQRFDSLTTLVNAQSLVTHEWLERLEDHAARTNGRVHEVEDKLSEVEKGLLTHPLNCNKGKEIEGIEIKVDEVVKDLEEYRMFKKYPKLFFVLLTIIIIGLIISAYGTFHTFYNSENINTLNSKIDNLGTPVIVNERGAVVPLPAGDSLKFFRDGEFKSTMRDTQ